MEADLHKTDAKSSTFLHLPPESQWLDSWDCFDHCSPHSLLLIIVTMFAQGCLPLFLIFYSLSFQNVYSPQGRDHFLWCASDMAFCPCTGTSRHKWQRNNHYLPAKEMVTSLGHISKYQQSLEKYCWPLQEPAWKGWKARTAHLQVHCRNSQQLEFSLSVYPPFSSSLYRKTDCTGYFTEVYSLPFTFRSQRQQSLWEMKGACNANRCGHPLYSVYLPGGDGAPKAGFSCGLLQSHTN